MPDLSFSWTPLSNIIADLKTLMGLNVGTRLTSLESASSNGVPDAVLNRISALESAVNDLSTALSAYTAQQSS